MEIVIYTKPSLRWLGVILFLVLLLTACSSKLETPNYDMFVGMNQSIKSDSIKTLDDVILASDYIVLGNLQQTNNFETSETLYTMQIEQQLKGANDIEGTVIDVASQADITADHDQYLLFLDYFDTEEFQSPIYISIIHSNPITKDTFTEGPFKDEPLSKITKLVAKSSQITKYSSYPRKIIEEASSLEELYELSDYVINIKPISIDTENSRIKTMTFQLNHIYKGNENIKNRKYVSLPSDTKLDQEYIIFFKNNGEKDEEIPSLDLSTRVGSIIAKDDIEAWNNTIKILEAIN